MQFDLSKPQKLLREAARATLARECPLSRVRALMANNETNDKSLWSAIADQGWIGLHLDAIHGCLDLGLVELAVVAEEMGRACLPGPFLATTWAATMLAQIEDPLSNSNRQPLLPSIASGEHKVTVGLLDQDTDWDVKQIQIQLTSAPSGWKLTGRKTLVLDAETADTILCVVRYELELAIVLVPMNTAGIRIEKKRCVDATRALHDVVFDGVSIADLNLIAIGYQAISAIEYSTQVATMCACAEMLGAMQWIHEATLEYVQTRKQFDKTIGSYQAVQHQCADILLMTESARAATYYAAWALSAKESDASKAVAVAKAYCSDMGREVAHRGVQLHGGIGFTWEHDIHLFLKRIKVCEFLFGDADYQREQIARSILK